MAKEWLENGSERANEWLQNHDGMAKHVLGHKMLSADQDF